MGTATASTTLHTSLSGGGQSGASITVPPSTAVTDTATLTGTNAASATGTVTYDVYSDSACTTAVNSGTAQMITTPGTLPASSPVTLPAGTYYWQASYSGDTTNAASTACVVRGRSRRWRPPPCGAPVTTSLSGAGKSAPHLGTPEHRRHRHRHADRDERRQATGTVTYNVYSDSACTTAVEVARRRRSPRPAPFPLRARSPSPPGPTTGRRRTPGDTPTPRRRVRVVHGRSRDGGDRDRGHDPAHVVVGRRPDGATISVPPSTAVTDTATLTGTNAHGATGRSPTARTPTRVAPRPSSGTAKTITTPGTPSLVERGHAPRRDVLRQASYSG